MSTTGADLRKTREQLGLSRRELSDLCGLTQARIWRLEQSPLDGDAKDLDVQDAQRVIDAMEKWHNANPEGKPAKTPKTVKTITVVDPRPTAQLSYLSGAVQIMITHITEVLVPELKEKKISSAWATGLAEVLTNALNETEKVEA